MNNSSILQACLLTLIVALAGCDSNQGGSTGSVTSTTETARTPNPAPTQPVASEPSIDHSEHTADTGGMGGMDSMGGMGGMGGGMGGMGGGMGGMGGGMDHELHRQHMAGMGDMDHEQHRQHMREMSGMDPSAHADHSAHMHGDTTAMAADMAGINDPQLSAEGLYTASVTSALDPIVINQIHSWTLNLKTTTGEPVENAVITVDGGMPAHNHGLPTAPEVTEALGNGDYLVEGLMFQMPGHWQVSFTISADDQTDSVTFNFTLE